MLDTSSSWDQSSSLIQKSSPVSSQLHSRMSSTVWFNRVQLILVEIYTRISSYLVVPRCLLTLLVALKEISKSRQRNVWIDQEKPWRVIWTLRILKSTSCRIQCKDTPFGSEEACWELLHNFTMFVIARLTTMRKDLPLQDTPKSSPVSQCSKLNFILNCLVQVSRGFLSDVCSLLLDVCNQKSN